MPIVIIVEKNGSLVEKKLSESQFDPELFYKYAKFKSSNGFDNEASWEVDVDDKKYNISLFAKSSGRAGQENKYDLPPPVDDVLYFGRCLLVNEDGTDLTLKLWEKIYEELFGGFEDIGDEDSEEEEEDITGVKLSKDGYMMDSFIADDDETESGDGSYDDAVEIMEGKRNRNSIRKLSHEDMCSDDEDDEEFFCTDELEEEEYE